VQLEAEKRGKAARENSKSNKIGITFRLFNLFTYQICAKKVKSAKSKQVKCNQNSYCLPYAPGG
jgi:hypothetical protein